MHKSIPIFLSIITIGAAPIARACDVCGCYAPQLNITHSTDDTPERPGDSITSSGRFWALGFYGAVAEQFTYFGTVQLDGNEQPNPTDQYLESSITQLVAGYAFNERFGLQLNLPMIYRSYKRPEGFAIEHGTESGLGDISLLGKFVAYDSELALHRHRSEINDGKSMKQEIAAPDFAWSVVLLAGIKFPTGDTSRIKEEFNEEEVPGAPQSGIHGHDLTLGTGSYDGVFGTQISGRYRNWFAQFDLQFRLRGDGLHQYDFANDLSWAGGPGYYLIHRRDATLGLQFIVSGEYKDTDVFRGESAVDTGITSVFVGPRVVGAYGRWSLEVALDLPVLIENTAFQAVPDYRIRSGIAIQF
jgi:hypothetical protein